MKNLTYIFDATCVSAKDELEMINELREENGLSKINFEQFIRLCRRPTEEELQNWLNEYKHCREQDVFAYELKNFLE